MQAVENVTQDFRNAKPHKHLRLLHTRDSSSRRQATQSVPTNALVIATATYKFSSRSTKLVISFCVARQTHCLQAIRMYTEGKIHINMQQQLLLILITSFATCRAGLLALSPEDFQQAGDIKIATIVHNAPSAVSHTTFTRVHNHRDSGQTTQPQLASTVATQTTEVHQPKPSVASQPVYTPQQLSVFPTTIIKHELPKAPLLDSAAATAAAGNGGTPIANSLTHTPAHLTYSARPVVYQTLPEIKPVRKISFDESVPSPRNKQYYGTH